MDNIDKKIIQLTKEKTISGETLSSFFGISRTAIWKRIKKLEKLGYKFSHLKEGYKLILTSPYLLETEIKPFIKTRLIGKEYIFFEEIDSTNIYAKENNLNEGTVIVAETQTKGKGRKGRKWISTKGKGLYFSTVLKPEININQLLRFSLIFPYSVYETIKQENLTPKIKWPNDIYLSNRKVSGILMETDIEGSEIKKLVVGIGININHNIEDLNEIKDIATSLFLEKGQNIDRKRFFIRLLQNIEKNYFQFLENKLNPIEKVEENLLWKDEEVKILDGNKEIKGILKGLDNQGGIILQIGNNLESFYSGDLSLRKT